MLLDKPKEKRASLQAGVGMKRAESKDTPISSEVRTSTVKELQGKTKGREGQRDRQTFPASQHSAICLEHTRKMPGNSWQRQDLI